MTKEWTIKTPKQKNGRWWKVSLLIVLLLGVGLYFLSQRIDSIAHTQVNQALGKFLTKGGTVASVTIEWEKGQIDVRGLKINRPDGFGKTEVLTLDHLLLNYDLLSLLSDKVLIDELSLSGLSLQSVRDKTGHFSVETLLLEALNVEPEKADNTAATSPTKIPAIHIDKFRLNDVSLKLLDHQLEKDWSASLKINLSVDDLHLHDVMKYDISTGAIAVKITDVALQQMAGYREAPMLKLVNLELESPGINAQSDQWKIKRLLLDQFKASFERDAKGATNAELLFSAWFPEASASIQVADAKSDVVLPTLLIDDAKLTSISAEWLSQIEGQNWRAGFDELNIRLTDVELGELGLTPKSLSSAEVTLQNVAIDQYPGSATQKFLTVKQAIASAGKLDMAYKELVVNEVKFDDVQSTITMRKDSPTNVERLLTALFGDLYDSDEQQKGTVDDPADATESSFMPAILLEHVTLSQGVFNYYDQVLTKDVLHFAHMDIELDGKQVRLFESNLSVAPSPIKLTYKMPQINDLPDAYFAAYGNMGPINDDVPMLNAQGRLVGFKLDSLGSLASASTRSALGVDGFDAKVALELDSDEIELDGSVVTDKNIRYDSIRVEGPLASPNVTVGAIFSKLYGRVYDGLKNLGKGGVNAGGELAKGGVNVVKEVGGGVYNVGKNISKGLYDIGSGAVTLNAGKMGTGFSETTKGTAGSLANTVKGIGSAASSGVSDSAGQLSSSQQKKAWDTGISARYEIAIKEAEKALAVMPYPPKITIRPVQQAPK